MAKPAYYLWKSDFTSDDALSKAKKKYAGFGFRVVVYHDGQNEKDIHDGLKALIKNHIHLALDKGGFL